MFLSQKLKKLLASESWKFLFEVFSNFGVRLPLKKDGQGGSYSGIMWGICLHICSEGLFDTKWIIREESHGILHATFLIPLVRKTRKCVVLIKWMMFVYLTEELWCYSYNLSGLSDCSFGVLFITICRPLQGSRELFILLTSCVCLSGLKLFQEEIRSRQKINILFPTGFNNEIIQIVFFYLTVELRPL